MVSYCKIFFKYLSRVLKFFAQNKEEARKNCKNHNGDRRILKNREKLFEKSYFWQKLGLKNFFLHEKILKKNFSARKNSKKIFFRQKILKNFFLAKNSENIFFGKKF